ncbi:putative lipoxygenase 6 [Curcuma longa]|uniref:putative lipoxygenase 6 n=1 Tax=Curcuma longa TaxID=136217 RepID=UPI003D9EC798
MAACSEIMGFSEPSFLTISGPLLRRGNQNKHSLAFPALYHNEPGRGRRLRPAKTMPTPVKAATNEDVIKMVTGKQAKMDNVMLRAALTVRRKHKEDIKEAVVNQLDALTDKIGWNVALELISTEINPRTKKPKTSRETVIKDWYEKKNVKGEHVVYTAVFEVDSGFGEPGAITVINRHQKEFFLESIVVEGEGLAFGPVNFPCNSWVQSNKDLPSKRIFFSNKPYLPSETPAGQKELREMELNELRGDGKGIRKLSDRVYDYATYNDLGNPDRGFEFARPTLGGEKIPYPRRCRTGRPPTDTNLLAESRVEKPHPIYVPRDEAFEELKQGAFSAGRLKAVLHNFIPSLIASISADNHDFKGFHHIDNLYKEGLILKLGLQEHLLKKLPFVKKIQESSEGLLRYDTPSILTKDKFAWLRDDEFARQAVAGINPVSIERLQEFPPVSKLDPAVYGPPGSAITEAHISGQLDGLTVQEAVEEDKLFMLDFYDIYLPFVDRINVMDGRKAYATRTLFFLTPIGTLKPIAIELGLPPQQPGSSCPSVVLTPPRDATTNWLWMLGKAHVCSNDAGVHQLVDHWLRTHAAMEPFIMLRPREAVRKISAASPLMDKQATIHAQKKNSCIDQVQALNVSVFNIILPDYPYADDGLLLWSAIARFVSSYVRIYYPDSDPSRVRSDSELQAWYHECVNVGHADHRHASWWPRLDTSVDLVTLLTTLIWLASAQHAALNFGQYPLGGYVPSRPPLMRRLIPDLERDADEFRAFLADPHCFFLSALPSVLQATKFMAVVDTLSTHSPDEEYLGETRDGTAPWTADEEAAAAYKAFAAEMAAAQDEIDRRNADTNTRNRCGAGVLPYELLAPSSGPGVTGRGVPNSVSI